MLVKDMNIEELAKKNQFEATRPYSKEEILKVTKKSEIIKSNKIYIHQDTKKNKIYEFLKNILYFIIFCLVVYLGTPDKSKGERYEGGGRGIHR